MLVLTRRPQEAIVIGGTVHVRVVEVNGNKVRLGITAPRGIAVDRAEIHEQKQAQIQRESVQLDALPEDPHRSDTGPLPVRVSDFFG